MSCDLKEEEEELPCKVENIANQSSLLEKEYIWLLMSLVRFELLEYHERSKDLACVLTA